MAALARICVSRRLLLGVAVSVAAVAVVTGAIAALRLYVPVLSLGGLYVFAALGVAIFWGLGYALLVGVASMLVFDFFFLPPVHSLAIADSRSWYTLVILVVTLVVVAELGALSRRRGREAELLARVGTSLLVRGEVSGKLDEIASEAARVLEVHRARIELGGDLPPERVEIDQALTVGDRRVGRILVEGRMRRFGSGRRWVLSALASLLSVAIERERLADEAYQGEAFRRSDAVKTAIIQAVSHDFRTPLATMETALETIRDPSLLLADADRVELLHSITLEHARLKRLVENLLDLSRLQAGAAEPAPQLLTVDQLIVAALEEVDGSERVNAVVPEDLPLVRVDVMQIQRVLVNILENALKFSSSATPVELRASCVGSEVVIRVMNAGRVIPRGELSRIFEPFQRLAGERVRGAGLGLAIARGFAEANGGRVWADSLPKQGVSFVVALPAAARSALVSV